MMLARLESEATAAAARQVEKAEQRATIQGVVTFKAKEREDVIRRVTRFNPGNAHVCGLSRHGM
jgi:hypothetical protein